MVFFLLSLQEEIPYVLRHFPALHRCELPNQSSLSYKNSPQSSISGGGFSEIGGFSVSSSSSLDELSSSFPAAFSWSIFLLIASSLNLSDK